MRAIVPTARGARVVALVAALTLASASACTSSREDSVAPVPKTSNHCKPEPSTPKWQVRGTWLATVSNIDWPSKPGLSAHAQQTELIAWLDLAKAKNLNTVMLQVRPTGDAFWPSHYEPWSQWLTGTQGRSPGYDPLAFAVREAHERNLELHAWFNPYRASATAHPSDLVPEHPARKHPDWVFKYGDSLYYNPGIPEVRRFVEATIMDAVDRYDFDGVHFDDYFYPYPLPGKKLPDKKTFQKYGAGFDTIEGWRRNNVNQLVRELDARIHAAKPWMKFGISPFGIWRNKGTDPRGSATKGLQSYDDIYADTRTWVKRGWVDYINPQLYWNIGFEVADYAKLVPWWAGVVRGTDVHLYVGQAAYRLGSAGPWKNPAELSRHLTFDRAYPEVRGDVHFSAKSLRDDPIHGVTRMVHDQYSRPALVPPIRHLGGHAPLPPAVTSASDGDHGVTVRWHDRGSRKSTSYAVYRFDGGSAGTCGFADARHLLTTKRRAPGTTQTFTDTATDHGKTYTYYVTAFDRLDHESRAGAGHTLG